MDYIRAPQNSTIFLARGSDRSLKPARIVYPVFVSNIWRTPFVLPKPAWFFLREPVTAASNPLESFTWLLQYRTDSIWAPQTSIILPAWSIDRSLASNPLKYYPGQYLVVHGAKIPLSNSSLASCPTADLIGWKSPSGKCLPACPAGTNFPHKLASSQQVSAFNSSRLVLALQSGVDIWIRRICAVACVFKLFRIFIAEIILPVFVLVIAGKLKCQPILSWCQL